MLCKYMSTLNLLFLTMDDGELILLDNVIADAPWVEGSQNTSFGRTFMWIPRLSQNKYL